MTEDQQEKQLHRIWDKASKQTRRMSIPELCVLAKSRVAAERLFALIVMRRQIENRQPVRGYFQIAERLIADVNNNCRWQALIVVSEFIRESPDQVWPLVLRYGSSADDDMRAGVACVLLEHLLELNRSKYERLVRRQIKAGNDMLADTLETCWDRKPGARRQSG